LGVIVGPPSLAGIRTDLTNYGWAVSCRLAESLQSKGLEYNSVVFIGLEDGAHWKFNENPSEEQCGMFVTLSRAKERVVFTFSSSRVRKGRMREQNRNEIAPLYQLLSDAGVEVETIP
jgi:superfamily I DNA/RNA helicase